jgi:hypothetical protein
MVNDSKVHLPGTLSILFAFCICIMAVFFVVESFVDHEHVSEGFHLPDLPGLQQMEADVSAISSAAENIPSITTSPVLPPPENLLI